MHALLDLVLPTPKEASRRAIAAGSPGVFREMGCGLLGKALDPKGPTDKGLNRLIRAERRLGSKDRPLVVDTLYGVLRRKSLLECMLQLAHVDCTVQHLWQLELVLSHRIPPEQFGLPESFSDARSFLESSGRFAGDLDLSAIATLSSLPLWIVEELAQQESLEELPKIAASLSQQPETTLRVNIGKTSAEALSEVLRGDGVELESGRHCLDALRVRGRPNLRGSKAFREGLFEFQDEASQLVSLLVEPVRGGTVLDYCAGSGGKSLAIAGHLPRRGRILAADPRRRAIEEARKRLERAGAKRWRLHCYEDGPLPLARGSAARVLVDAPCTGIGSLRHHPVRKWRIQRDELGFQVQRQSEILREAAQWVSPGGRLIYVTCSLLRAENEERLESFLTEHPGWRMISIREVLGRTRSRPFERGPLFRSYPHRHATDGFVAGILVAPRVV